MCKVAPLNNDWMCWRTPKIVFCRATELEVFWVGHETSGTTLPTPATDLTVDKLPTDCGWRGSEMAIIIVLILYWCCSWFSGWLWQNIRTHHVLFSLIVLDVKTHWVFLCPLICITSVGEISESLSFCTRCFSAEWLVSLLSTDLHLFHHFVQFLPTRCLINHLSLVMRIPVFALCEQQRRRSTCTSAQSDQHLCSSLPG